MTNPKDDKKPAEKEEPIRKTRGKKQSKKKWTKKEMLFFSGIAFVLVLLVVSFFGMVLSTNTTVNTVTSTLTIRDTSNVTSTILVNVFSTHTVNQTLIVFTTVTVNGGLGLNSTG